MTQDLINKLSAPFPFEAVEAKIQVNGTDKNTGAATGMVVFYVDSRTIQNRLDEVLGHFNWKNQYLTWQNNAQLCGIAIYNEERNEWIPKYDGAECSNIEPIKGGLSDSFKRAACVWGIGRYLYEIEGVWVYTEQRGKGTYVKKDQQSKLKEAYEAAVNKIFGAGTVQPSPGSKATDTGSTAKHNQPVNNRSNHPPAAHQNHDAIQPPPAQQNANTKQPPPPQPSGNEQKPQDNVLQMHDFKIHSMKPAGKESQLLELCNADGEITSAYVRSNVQGIAVGVRLRNVKFQEKSNLYGKYNLLTNYEVAA